MIIAQITDLHIVAPEKTLGVFDTAAALERAVETISDFEPTPDAIIISGDLVDRGKKAEYDRLLGLLEPLTAPLFVIPGNHDRRDPMRDAFASRAAVMAAEGPLCFAESVGPVRIIGLDTLVEGHHHGEVGSNQLAWLEDRLAEAPTAPTLLTLHHPPFKTGLSIDGTNCQDADALVAIVARHPQIRKGDLRPCASGSDDPVRRNDRLHLSRGRASARLAARYAETLPHSE